MNKITFPFNGINNNNSYETQPLGTCASAQNVRGYDAIKGRLRGGQRAGLSKFIDTEINSGATIHDLNYIKTMLPKDDALSDYILVCSTGIIYKYAISDGTRTTFYSTGGSEIIYEMVRDSAGNVYICHQTDGTGTISKINSAGVLQWQQAPTSGARGIAYDENRNRVIVRAGVKLLGLAPEDGSTVFTSDDIGSAIITLMRTRIDSTGYYYTNGLPTNVDGYYRQLWKINPVSGAIEWQFCVRDFGSSYCTGFDINSDDEILIGGLLDSTVWGIAPTGGQASSNIWKVTTDGTVIWNDSVANGTSKAIDSLIWSIDGDLYAGFAGDAVNIQTIQKLAEADRSVLWDYSTGADVGHNVYHIQENTVGDYIYVGTDSSTTWENTDSNSKAVFKLPSDGAGSMPTWAGDAVAGRYLATKSDGTSLDAATIETISIISEGDVYKHRDATISTITGGDNALQSKKWVMSQPAYGDIFLVDGKVSLYYDIAYTSADDEIKIWTAISGTLPTYCRLIGLYRGRILLSATEEDPHNWFMSKVGDPFDWDYFPSTTSAIQAVAGNNSEVGLIGDNVTGMAPWSDDLCIFGCDSSLWLMAGDPAAGGSIDLITDKTGMTFGKAWCFDPNGVMYFHGVGGIYRLIPGGKPESITDDSIKRVMESLDLSSYYIRLYWDINQGGLYMVYIKQDYSVIGSIYFWDMKQNAWWYDEYLSATTTPLSFYAFDADAADDRHFLMGCKDGYIRKVDKTATTDDGVGINSEVILGPYIASPGKSLRLSESDITLGKTSGNLDLYVYSGDYAEDVIVSSNTRVKRTLKAGLNHRINQRVKAPALKFKFSSPASITTQWALENLSISIKESGTTRGGRV